VKKLSIAALLALLMMVSYSYWNRRVQIPMTKVYVHVPLDAKPRLWANAVEFDHWLTGKPEICYSPDWKTAKCGPLKAASPTSEPAVGVK